MPSIKPVAGKTQIEVERLDDGLDTSAGPNQVSIYGSPDCLNVKFDQFGSVETRNGSEYVNLSGTVGSFPIDGMQTYNGSHIFWSNGTMYSLVGSTPASISGTTGTFVTGANVASVVYQQVLFCSEGTSGPWRYETDGSFYKMGIATPSAPTAVSNVGTVTGGGPEGGTYYYKVSYIQTHVVEGSYGSMSAGLTIAATAVVNVQQIPIAPSSAPATARYIYRASTSAGTFRFIGQLANNTASTFTDTVGAVTWAVGATGSSDRGGPTPFTTIRLHKDTLFEDDSSDRSILRYTDYRTPYISAAANFINMDKGAGANIVGIAVQEDLVTVGTDAAIWVVSLETPGTPATWQWFKTPGNVGFVGPKCFVETDNALFFLGKRFNRISGFHVLSGVKLIETRDTRLRSDRISNRIESTILDLPKTYWANTALATYNNQIFAAVTPGSETTNKYIFWLDANRLNDSGEVGSWALWSGRGAQINNMLVHNGLLYGGSSQGDGFILKMELDGTYNDCGQAINSYFWTKKLGGEQSVESWIKDWRYVNIWHYKLGAFTMLVNYRVDDDTSEGSGYTIDLTDTSGSYGSAIFGVDLYGGGATDSEAQHSLGSAQGRRIQFRFSNSATTNTGFRVHGFKVLANMRRQIKEAA